MQNKGIDIYSTHRTESSAYPDSELVGIGKRMAVVGVYNNVLTHSHCIALDILRNALGVAREELEPHRIPEAAHA
ncbi:hypothetical protein G2W53_042125 [Senna tora]|uniref:Uncharacterized protein n=1 Tax=Senna tora TaxID=362788 RepID=A0A834W3I2_9FABA|nr:hypothetical protein G2W53_042125 [Senna tora]